MSANTWVSIFRRVVVVNLWLHYWLLQQHQASIALPPIKAEELLRNLSKSVAKITWPLQTRVIKLIAISVIYKNSLSGFSQLSCRCSQGYLDRARNSVRMASSNNIDILKGPNYPNLVKFLKNLIRINTQAWRWHTLRCRVIRPNSLVSTISSGVYNMKMKNLGLIISGSILLYLGINDFLMGQTVGYLDGNIPPASITFSTNPIEFSLSIAFKVIVGSLLMVQGLCKIEFKK